MIQDVVVVPLKTIADERGKVMHMLRCDNPLFEKFGEIYFSVIKPGAIKAWKLHRKMTLNIAVPVGSVLFVLYDNRPESSTRGKIQEISIGNDNYCLVKIPPLIWTGFKGTASIESVVANCATLPHTHEEAESLGIFDPKVPYNWKINKK
ncbi:WxcM-like protein [Candidatus Magnetobacterium bavaricum]|uniref:dTDP-4-dehydrorhamnose 3,5-epimerase n=1 Tax=Candidatus Magnetobacterium bavaricum TaxID=29290 RepID=A0A0F3GJU6_9BACT|nr:WxcM-like protein [Candidatus Magnetobacterium bavaricum]